MSNGKKPVKNPTIVLREEFDNWAILYNPDTSDAIGINPVGISIWKMIDGTRDVTDFEEEIKRNFSQVPASISSDIESFLNELEKKRYIKQHFGE